MADIRLDPGAVPQPDPQRAGAAARNAAAEQATNAPGATRQGEKMLAPDTVELSADAQAVGSAEAIPKGEVPADRLREVGQRLASGHYDQPDVQATVADKVKGDLGAV